MRSLLNEIVSCFFSLSLVDCTWWKKNGTDSIESHCEHYLLVIQVPQITCSVAMSLHLVFLAFTESSGCRVYPRFADETQSILDLNSPDCRKKSFARGTTMSCKPFVLAALALLLPCAGVAHGQDSGPYNVVKFNWWGATADSIT
jgi:hypothetical protein